MAGFSLLQQSGEHSSQARLNHDSETRIALLLLAELIAALCANESDTFKRWLSGGIQDLGKPALTELMTDWMTPLLTQKDKDRLVGWHLGVSL